MTRIALYHNPHFLAYQDDHAQIPPPQRPVAFVALPDDLDLDPPALLNAAYSHTQHGYTQASWYNDPLVTPCLRSTAVGDLIGLPDGRLYVVERFGFRPYQPPADGALQQLAAAYRQLDDARSGSQAAQQRAVEAALVAMSRLLDAPGALPELVAGLAPEPVACLDLEPVEGLDPEPVAGADPEPGEWPVPWEKARPGDLIRGLTLGDGRYARYRLIARRLRPKWRARRLATAIATAQIWIDSPTTWAVVLPVPPGGVP
jgi:hypothetical protein